MTAVEWLIDKYFGGINNCTPEFRKQIYEAKELEKEQIIEAAYFGHLKGWVDDGFENSYGEQYYNETYKSE